MASPTVDRRLGLVGNIAMKAPVTALAAGNLLLSGEQSVDGVAVKAINSVGVADRVLCTAQTDATQNGIWDVSTGPWTRSADADGNYDLGQGSTVLVNQGTTYAGSYWKISTSGSITIGTTPISWTRALASSLSTLSFLQAGTGATSRGGQDKMRDVVSVKDFGAVGDGASHPLSGTFATLAAALLVYPFVTALAQETDYAAWQAAINAANTLGGAVVYAPAGTYKTNTDTLVNAKYVTLQGSGKRATVLSYAGTGHAVYKAERINSSVAVHTAARDLGITMTNGAATGGCYVDVGGSFVEVTNCAFTGGKFGAVLDQSELATIRLCDIEAQVAAGAGVWLVNGADHTPAVTFTAAPAAAATTGTLTGAWAGASGTYNLDFTETVGGAHEQRMATLTNSSTVVTWSRGLSAACNAATTGGGSQFTNRILISECQFNNGAVAASHIIDDGGISHAIKDNNFNSGIVAATPPMCRFCGIVGLNFSGNEMEGGQTCMAFSSTTNYGGVGAGATINTNILGNVFSMSQPNTPITCTAGAGPMLLIGNWFGGASTYKVTGAAFLGTTFIALGNLVNTGTLIDGTPPQMLQVDNTGTFCAGMLSTLAGIGYTTGAGGAVTQATNKATAVTLNAPAGQITMNNASLAAGASVSFILNNNKIAAPDVVTNCIASGASADSYMLGVTAVSSGQCRFQLANRSTSALAEAPVINFGLIKGSTS